MQNNLDKISFLCYIKLSSSYSTQRTWMRSFTTERNRMKLIITTILATTLWGCSHTMDVQTDWPSSQEDGSVSTGIWNTRATSDERRSSRYDVCLAKLNGTPNATAICEKRMKAYEPKRLIWDPYYGYRYQQGDSE